MLVVWGFKTYIRFLGIVTFVCGRCGNPAAQRLEERVRKFTFFWIPLFPVKRQTVATCTFCGRAALVAKEQVAGLLSQITPAAATAAPAEQTDTVTGPAAGEY